MSEININPQANGPDENTDSKAESIVRDNSVKSLETRERNNTVSESGEESDESSVNSEKSVVDKGEIQEGKEKRADTKISDDDEGKGERETDSKTGGKTPQGEKEESIVANTGTEKEDELPTVNVGRETERQESKSSNLERRGTDSGEVKIDMASETNSTTAASTTVITTAPTPTGPPKAKPKLQRRKSLNPRVMTPPGLEVLDNLQLLAIRQQMDIDIQGGCGSPNTYKIWNENDEQIFFASEDSGCLCRWACGPARRFSLDIFSSTDDQVLNFHRNCCRCDCCCCFDCLMCLQKLYVVDCLGRTIGAVKQKFSIFKAKFDIVDHDNNVLFKVLGPCCPCRCSTEIYFQIFNKTGERQIGRIQKKWGGDRTDNINVDHEYFDVTFPAKLDSVDKGLILGAAFLVNCMYLEMS